MEVHEIPAGRSFSLCDLGLWDRNGSAAGCAADLQSHGGGKRDLEVSNRARDLGHITAALSQFPLF